jgi:hypothetical protein
MGENRDDERDVIEIPLRRFHETSAVVCLLLLLLLLFSLDSTRPLKV